MAKIRNGSTYLANHLAANDYYAEGEKVSGQWVGIGATMLGLSGTVMPDQFEALRNNKRPDDDTPLTPRTRADRVAFFDFQCSAQKSVSLMAILGGDERLRAAHERSTKTAFRELERFASHQQNTQIARHSEITGNVCAAAFVHDASRALDPQLHTHFVVANATSDKDGRWAALNEFEMLKAIRYGGKVYQNELAREVKALGYAIREVRDSKGTVTGFEIEGVSDELCERFSKRRAEIEAEIEKFQSSNGRYPTPEEIALITRETRGAKLSEISTPTVRNRQLAQLTPEERQNLQLLKERATASATGVMWDGLETEALQECVAHLFERKSVAREHEILAEALNQRLGHIDLDRLKRALADPHAQTLMLTAESPLLAEYTTKHGLELERWSVAYVNATKDRCPPLNPKFVSSEKLSDEQREAVKAILSTGDQVYSFRGIAGAGKTTTLREVHRGFTEAGHQSLFIAPTTAAAKVLQSEGFSNATTVEDFLQNVSQRQQLTGAVIVCDEAGLKSNRQGAALLHLAQERAWRVLLVGDVRQHVSVEAGDFLRVLETHSRIGHCEVAEIRRQQVPAYKAAVGLLAGGDACGGLAALDTLGWLHEAGADYLQKAADVYLALTQNSADMDRVILVAPTWAENHKLTDAVRSGLKARGRLAQEGARFIVHDSLGWTLQQKRHVANYRVGQSIVFTRSTGPWKVGDSAEVREIRSDGKVMLRANGVERRLMLRAAKSFDVGQCRPVEIAPGEKLLMRGNMKRLGITNGQILTVDHVEADGTIRTKEGMRIPQNFRQWCHGYVVTSHKSQGRTCEEVIVAAEKLDAKAAYVACSRGRQSCSVYTPDKEHLMNRIPEGNRRAALDVLSEARPSVPAAISRRAELWSRSPDQRTATTGENPNQRPETEKTQQVVQRWNFVRRILGHKTAPRQRQ